MVLIKRGANAPRYQGLPLNSAPWSLIVNFESGSGIVMVKRAEGVR
jgi:hypothetical protein